MNVQPAFYTLTLLSSPGGTLSGGGSYAPNAVANAVATAAPGNSFAGWTGDLTGASSTTQPCPKEYTNVLSNTNLFTLDEQILFKNFSLKHKNVTTNDDKISSENFRAKSGDGYDVYFNGGSIERFLQFKGGVVNGLYVNFKDDHCMSWMHVENGKAIGKWYEWDDAGNLKLEAEFKKPSNFMEQFKFNPPR